MKRFRWIGLAGLAAAAAFALAQGITLKRTLKVGDTSTLHVVATFDIQSADATYSLDITDKVTKVADDGTVTVEKSFDNSQLTVGGNDTPADNDPVLETTYSPRNELKTVSPLDDTSNFGPRNLALTAVVFPDHPVNVGDTWDYSRKADANGFVDLKATYKVDSMDKVGDIDTIKIKASSAESNVDSAATCDGFIWIDPNTGWTVKADLQITNFPSSHGPFDVHLVETKA